MSPRSVLLLSLLASAAIATSLPAQTVPPAASSTSQAAGPAEFQVKRAEKIAKDLHLGDAAKTARVSNIIARQYYDLGLIQAAYDDALKSAKSEDHHDKKAFAHAKAAALAAENAATDKLHGAYLARLGAELTPEQIDAVKDGMTYHVVEVTYRVYQEMLPTLTPEQKAQIHAWLVEAREHAMDAGTSKAKHAWFGKYKGRINIYLTKQGYDLKAAEQRLFSKHKH
ncbi:hypothetical protein GALL_95890 [mine drainage metagenome]|uniref:DUF3826 domain-containing protein n=1 Tax=mine drainage metagenome TaxID=410659 RepID=A0A1J5SI43_9ZZZZ